MASIHRPQQEFRLLDPEHATHGGPAIQGGGLAGRLFSMATAGDTYQLLEDQVAFALFGNRTLSTALLAWFIENVMREDPDQVEDAICDGWRGQGH